MTTVGLFREDAYLTSCAAAVTAIDERGGVILDRTVFYPTGGGQPGDSGFLLSPGGVRIAIATTVKGAAPGEIVHVLAKGAGGLKPGDAVVAEIDVGVRRRLMRMHTALHLLSVVIPLPVTGGSIGADKGRLDFDMPEAPGDRDALEAELNALIVADHPVRDEWISAAELEANPGLVKTMAVRPPMGQGRVRLVRIGAGAPPVDLQPCGGVHVRSTAEIGPVHLGKIEKKGKRNRRVNLLFAE